ncbi:hypothetical protein [Kamptonema formosum]|nr:hypothetical protein [Oscillatoria sp. PCC 10802]
MKWAGAVVMGELDECLGSMPVRAGLERDLAQMGGAAAGRTSCG